MPAVSTASVSCLRRKAIATQHRNCRYSSDFALAPGSSLGSTRCEGPKILREIAAGQRPLIRKIADFPLVAMIVAAALFVLASALGTYLGKFVPASGQPATAAVHMMITISLVLVVYKL